MESHFNRTRDDTMCTNLLPATDMEQSRGNLPDKRQIRDHTAPPQCINKCQLSDTRITRKSTPNAKTCKQFSLIPHI